MPGGAVQGIFHRVNLKRRAGDVGRSWLFALGLCLSAAGCGGPAITPQAEVPEAEAPRPRNAAAIAQEIAGGKVSALVYAERTRGHPLAAKIAALNLWGPVLDGTGINPQEDVARAFVTAPSVRAERDAVVVLEHTLSAERLQAGLDALRARSDPPASPLEGMGVPAMRVTVKGHTRVVAVVEPSFLIVLPEGKASQAKRFVGTGGFPDPEGPEAVVASAADPAQTLKAPRAPAVPETVRSLEARVVLGKDGGADVALEGVSASPEQARTDAGELTDSIDRATSFQISIVKVRVFDPVKFSAEGDRVRAKRRVTPEEIDRLFGLLSAMLPR